MMLKQTCLISLIKNLLWKEIIQHAFLPSQGVFHFVLLIFSRGLIIFYRQCSILHPSWAELAQFVRFLYVQLNDCQSSIYCNQEFFAAGKYFKKFVVEFMIRMSQVGYCFH